MCRIDEDALSRLHVHSLDQPLQHQHAAIAVLAVHLVGSMLTHCEVTEAYPFALLSRQMYGIFIAGMSERWQASRVIAKRLQSLYGAIFKIDNRYHARNLPGSRAGNRVLSLMLFRTAK